MSKLMYEEVDLPKAYSDCDLSEELELKKEFYHSMSDPSSLKDFLRAMEYISNGQGFSQLSEEYLIIKSDFIDCLYENSIRNEISITHEISLIELTNKGEFEEAYEVLHNNPCDIEYDFENISYNHFL